MLSREELTFHKDNSLVPCSGIVPREVVEGRLDMAHHVTRDVVRMDSFDVVRHLILELFTCGTEVYKDKNIS